MRLENHNHDLEVRPENDYKPQHTPDQIVKLIKDKHICHRERLEMKVCDDNKGDCSTCKMNDLIVAFNMEVSDE